MTPRERAEKYADQIKDDWTREELISFIEQIIKDEIKMCAEVREGIGTGLGLMGNALINTALSRIGGARTLIEAEREACAKIADENVLPLDEKYEHYHDRTADEAANSRAKWIAGAIRARGGKKS